MSQIPETADLEAQIEALIKRAGDSLRQQLDNVHRDPSVRGPDDASRSSPSSTADGPLGNAESRVESTR
jgi:hypothetical protein